MRKPILIIVPSLTFVCCLLASSGARAQTLPGSARTELLLADTLDREVLVRAVLESNPRIAVARSVLAAARQLPIQARSLDDPVLSYSLSPGSGLVGGARFGQAFRYSQRLPYPGTRRIEADRYAAEADASERDLEALQISLAARALTLFDDYYLVARAREINDEHLDLLRSFQRIATARYAAGRAPQQAPLLAEVELAHLLRQKVILESDRTVLIARINTLLHRSPESPLPLPPERLAIADDLEHSVGQLVGEALEARPEVEAHRSRSEAQENLVRLAQLAFKPSFEVSGSYNSMWNERSHRSVVGVTFNLPVRRRRIRAAEAEAHALLAAANARLETLEQRVRSEVTIAAAELAAARRIASLYRSRLLPAANDQVASALSGFRAGQNTFLDLIDAERSQRRVRLDYERALTEVSQGQTMLARALGRRTLVGNDPPLPDSQLELTRDDQEVGQ